MTDLTSPDSPNEQAGITRAYHVPAILRRAKAMGLVPQDVAIAGSLDGAFALTWTPADARPSLTIEHASQRAGIPEFSYEQVAA